ncbi:MAG: DUF1080 domain-containing protein [Planctomycetes bacterium]|nr:DUF1080 domain-containing protein [Planctomycetota bacterium]
MRLNVSLAATTVAGLLCVLCAAARTAPAAAPPAAASSAAPEQGFVPIFNGKDLTGWDGNPKFWSVKDGAVRGETTKENPTKGNTFIIWRGGLVGDFDLRLSYRMTGGNSGIQYRSRDLGNWVVGGYQAEIANDGGRDGYIYDEKGKRGRMCLVGEKVTWGKDGKKQVTGSAGDLEKIKAGFKKDDWNEYRILVVGSHIQHFVNGVQTIDFTDEDEVSRAMSGILALQIHAGAPMVTEFKNIRLKKLGPDPAPLPPAPKAPAPAKAEAPKAK